ncbi:YlbF family regulator [Streptococcus equi subsp. zooepidemicus]|uniref:Regulatory protein ylbF n=1 Tax=Streptococcus equi subsp. zooepidemicus TaxID=40041 RepID=A0A7Z8ZUY9_STRSZ|nr:YlbF family regulator [Streptococcus equi]MCD3411319.1 YlbF family regulator [Streptococcus equi subsp. zooepidemicus]MCD3453541.1 YlbF family regulator [Streptococcus equi subsp. zooepidemicus]MDI6076096.1 YlbF family regulator [Streptococcus equi subsp. zooepidemicus]VEF04981.1 Regulatory protein ylbF [Streptococcus equi subsp. zooepidemicus]VTS35429.1 Regulatory protein ylbF [Streptococcus equi subsp. zooepidemicus]
MLIINEELFAIEKAIEQLVQDIRTSSQYQTYALAKKAFEADLALQTELALFEELKRDYELKQGLLESCPDARALRCQLLHQKRQLDLHPLVAELRLAQVDLQEVLATISTAIAEAVSEDILVDTGLPLATNRPRHELGPYQNIKEKST